MPDEEEPPNPIMPPDESPDPRSFRRRDPTGAKSEAWQQTLDEMEAIADGRREDGWEVVTVFAAHTDAVSKSMGEDDHFGLVHVLPDNHAEQFEEVWDPDAFTEYLAYGTTVETTVYLVTEFLDEDGRRSILVASSYNFNFAAGMVNSAREEGVLPTRLKTIDGTVVATFEHEEFDHLIPMPTDADG